MNKFLILGVISLLFIACSKNKVVQADLENLVPIPLSVDYDKDKSPFVLNKSTKIVYKEGDEDQKRLAGFLAEYIKQLLGFELDITTSDRDNNAIRLQSDLDVKEQEAYQLDISSDKIVINGASNAGLFYGIQTLRKSIPVIEDGVISFPVANINDGPRFGHRGASLDVSRHFFSADFVKKYIDVLAMYNMNVFHWHLTDDQGWRIEIKKYPKLTEIGSQRSGTAIDRHSEEYDGKPYGGFYTQEEIKDIVEYARQRYITVIPEIDIPGHTLAALTSYPHLGCTGGPYQVARGWGIFEDVLCAGNDSVFTFLDDVFTEVVELFPAKYIHIGGDECLKNRWYSCPKCQKRMKDLRLVEMKAHSRGEQLQSYFIHRVEEMINKKGKSIIGWDEILEGGIAPNATIMSWRGTEGGIYAAGKGHDVIMTPEAFLYLDYYQSAEVDKEPYTFGWLTPLEKVYNYDPMPHELPYDKKKHILGAQVNVWAEYMPTSDNVEYMLLPRMGALAETLWSYPRVKDYNQFVARMYKQSLLLDKLGYKNCKRAYEVQVNYDYDLEKHEVKAYLSTFDDSPIYYTLDGSEPTEASIKYESPVGITQSQTLNAVLYRDGVKSEIYSKDFSFNKATTRSITLKNMPDRRYTFNGAITLVDGQKGYKQSYRTGTWIGFFSSDLDATITLDKQTSVSSVALDMFVNTRGNLFLPKSVTVEVSDDGKAFRKVYTEKYSEMKGHEKPNIKTLKVSFPETKANYIHVILENINTAPAWHEKKGTPVYLMVDEIVVE
ncbi:MAG: family 20 glycosylhydrolase [Dysgonomonas sp.]|nr:family 20 glycosylhydrolase [Dysgonomonas sp.]